MKIKITGLPKYQQRPGTVGDDEWIRKIMEYEATKGSATGTGLSNWGYNSRNPKSIDEAINFYKEDFLPKVQQYPMGMRERMGDFMYNTGTDPRIYLLDQYIIEKEKGMGLPGRSLYKSKGLNNPDFDAVYSQYESKINELPLEERIKLLDQGKDFYYQNINQVNGKPNPSYNATWKPRVNMFGSYSAPTQQSAAPVQQTTQVTAPTTSSNATKIATVPNMSFPSLQQSIRNTAPGKCPPGQQKNVFTNQCEPIPNFGGSAQVQSNLGKGFMRDPETNMYSQPQGSFYTTTTTTSPQNSNNGIAVASAINSGLSFFNNTLQGIQENQNLSEFTRMYGQTDANNPVVSNVYSRGRNVMNTGEYAPNQMTPVQFAGRPVSEFSGYPVSPYNVYAQDGLNVTEDILGLPTLFSDPGMYASAPYMSNERPVDNLPKVNLETEVAANFTAPVKNYKISSGFGQRKAPTEGASKDHNGVDLAVPLNSAVFAPMDGVVENVYFNDKGGKQVIIKHADGSKSGFAHLNDYSVSIGDEVTKGQQIALSGNTGKSTGPHLHFTFRNPFGDFINPVDFFNLAGGSKSKYETGVSNWDHNNPGNIHSGSFAKNYGAVDGRNDNGGKVAIFPTMESGMKAMEDLIFSPSYNNLTISQARNRWVNGSANKYTSSSADIVRSMGTDVPVNQLNAQQRKQLLSEFIKWEDRNVYDKLIKKGYFEQGGQVSNNNINNTNMKIRITGVPNRQQFADGGRTVGDQMGYGLYRGQAVRDFDAFNKVNEDDYEKDVRSTEPGVPRKDANIEAEKGEKIIAPNALSIMDIGGKPHSKGGTPMDADPGSYILSNFITASKTMQDAMGFDVASKKKKDNTWSKVLDSKVKSKDFNRLSQILQDAAAGKQVDRFELAMAKSKMPLYQNYVSKAALGNELTKMIQGKPYEIPEIGMPALQQMFPDMAQQMMQQQQMMSQGQEQGVMPQEPMMAYGGNVALKRFQEGSVVPGSNLDTYNYLLKTTVKKDGDNTIITYPDGRYDYVFPNGRIKRTNTDGSFEMIDSTNGLTNLIKTPDGTVVLEFGDGSSDAYFKNGRTQHVASDGTKTMGTRIGVNEDKWDEENTTPSANVATPANPNDPYPNFKPWGGDKTTGKKNASKYSKQVWVDKLKALGYNGEWTNEDVQKFLYNNQGARPKIDALHSKYGMPSAGKILDGIVGVRWDDALDAAIIPTPTIPRFTPGTEGMEPPVEITGKTPSATGMKYICNPTAGGVIPIPAGMANQTPGSPITYYNSEREALAACGQKNPNFEGSPSIDMGNIPYTQDVLNFSNALSNQYAYPQIGPYAARYNPVYMDPAFISTEAADRLIQSQGRTAMEDASLYAGAPQVQAARQAQISGQVLPSMLQNRMQTNTQNVQTDMGARQFNAQIANQAGMLDAQISTQLGADNARYAMNRAKEKVAGKTMSKNMLNQLITNAGDTSLVNQWYPQYAFNPSNYQTYFDRNSGKTIQDQASGSDAATFSSNLQAAKQYADSLGLTSGKDRNDAIMDYLGISTGKPAPRRASPPKSLRPNTAVDQTQLMQEKNGGYIPMYQIGGWY